MVEFIQLCFSPINLLFTLMLICVMGYWAMFFIGAVGFDVLDDLEFDVDGDIDVDLDVDADVDLNVDAEVDAELDGDLDGGVAGGRSGMFISLMRFLNVGDVPLMVLVTALVGSLWAVSILSSHYLNAHQSLLIALALFIPNCALSLFVAKVVTLPARYVFRNSSSGIAKPTRIVGARCIVTTSTVTEKFGQAEIEQEDAAPITLNVRCRSGNKPLKKGDEALILELVEDRGTYIVVPFDLEVN
jgi:hypothetical protein